MCSAVAGILITLGSVCCCLVGVFSIFLCRGKGRLSSIQRGFGFCNFLLPLRLCTFGSSNRLVLQGIQGILGRIISWVVYPAQGLLLAPIRAIWG